MRHVMGIGLIALACGYAITALVGLPLFQDGAWYFFNIATIGVAELPNLCYAALLPQLPAVWAALLVEDAVMLRHIFSLSYVALPVASLLGCWLLAAAADRAVDRCRDASWRWHQAQVCFQLRGRVGANGPRFCGGRCAAARDRPRRSSPDRHPHHDLHGHATPGQVYGLVDNDPGTLESAGGVPRGLHYDQCV